jgi:hypothetical protein
VEGNCGKAGRKRLPTNPSKMAERSLEKSYTRLEKQFIEESYVGRVFQRAKEDGKIICHDCYTNDGSINFFTASGVDYHYRRAHKRLSFKSENSTKLFNELYFKESVHFVNELSKFRCTNNSSLDLFEEYLVNCEHLQTTIFARSKKESAKLAGLVLSHGNFVNTLSSNGYLVSVAKNESMFDFDEKFLVWKSSAKIYVEAVEMREVIINELHSN